MQTKYVLGGAQAMELIQAALRAAQSRDLVVSIAVVDDGGHALATLRMDGAPPVGCYMAESKARAAALGRKDTVAYEKMVNEGRTAYLSAAITSLGGALLEGGVQVLEGNCTVAAIGISGAKPEQDAEIAKAAIDAWRSKQA